MHTTHSVLQHYNHQVKYWWWFFAPTFYALVFFTKSLHHVYYNTQLFCKQAHFLCFFLLCSPSGGIKPFTFAISKFTNFQMLSKSVTYNTYKYFKYQHIQEFRSFCLHQILFYYYLKPYLK